MELNCAHTKTQRVIWFCIDFREIKKKAKFGTYPMLRADILLEEVGEARYLLSLNITKGYWRVPLWPQDCG